MATQLPRITVSAFVEAPIHKVWNCWNDTQHITNWNNASSDWHTPTAKNEVREGGTFTYTMAAKDGSMSFDFEGTYTRVEPEHLVSYEMPDGRKVDNVFEVQGTNVWVTVTFDPESQNPPEMQREGWQAILNNFKKYVEHQ